LKRRRGRSQTYFSLRYSDPRLFGALHSPEEALSPPDARAKIVNDQGHFVAKRLNSNEGTKTLTGFFATFYARRTFGNSAAPKIGSCLVDQFWGLTQPVHPHLFRHQMIAYLTSRGFKLTAASPKDPIAPLERFPASVDPRRACCVRGIPCRVG
jgi:hypothetical protein